MAQRAFSVLFPEYSPERPNAGKTRPLYYIGTAFEIAALLHDIGHCAFSHSIERVKIDGRPFFPTVAELANEWGKNDAPALSDWYQLRMKTDEYSPPENTQHEDLGLLMIGVLFGGFYPPVAAACKSVLKVNAVTFADDVRALLLPTLKPSDSFLEYADQITKSIPGASSLGRRKRAEHLLVALHTLISGTLDVDRLDYLIRDSHYTGTPYGVCDVDVLVNGLSLAVSRQEASLVLALRSRASRALDDFLWSRYQLFSQVLNHKTNVILNALLAEAVPQAIQEGSINVKQPRTFNDFLGFTDDYVMSAVIQTCLRSIHSGKAYDRALVHRELPLYLGRCDLSAPEKVAKQDIENKKREYAQSILRNSGRSSEIQTWPVKSNLIKGGGMPYVIEYDKARGRDILKAPGTPTLYQIQDWTRSGKVPAEVESWHFFVERDKV